jgi:hypothetical protein
MLDGKAYWLMEHAWRELTIVLDLTHPEIERMAETAVGRRSSVAAKGALEIKLPARIFTRVD